MERKLRRGGFETAQQAVVVAGAIGAAVLAISIVITLVAHLPWWLPPFAALIALLLGFASAGLFLVWDDRRIIWHAEGLLHVDIDDDGAIGEPEPAMRFDRGSTRIEITERDQGGNVKRMQYIRLPLSDYQIERLAEAVLPDGAIFSRRALEGLMSSETYTEVMNKMLDAGLLRQCGTGLPAGVELTGSGRAWLRKWKR